MVEVGDMFFLTHCFSLAEKYHVKIFVNYEEGFIMFDGEHEDKAKVFTELKEMWEGYDEEQ